LSLTFSPYRNLNSSLTRKDDATVLISFAPELNCAIQYLRPLASGQRLQYWIAQFSSGANDIRTVASSFLVSDEFKLRYGENVSDDQYVKTLYINVLNRELDQSGYDYWVGNLTNGIEQRHEVLLGFAESAENKALFTEMTGFG
jgi:hypothetical protein